MIPYEQQLLQRGLDEAARRSSACKNNCSYGYVRIYLPENIIIPGTMRECVLDWFLAEYPVPEGVRMEVERGVKGS